MNKKLLLILILIIALAAALRLYNPLFRSLWGDEAHSIYSAYNLSIGNILKDSHLPVYFVLLSSWIKLFGLGEYGIRFLSVIIGIMSIFAMYVFAKQMSDGRTSLIAALLLSLSPLALMHSHEIRVYGLFLLLTILSSKFFWKLCTRQNKISDYLFYLIFTILLGLTHIYAILYIFAQVIFICYRWFNGYDKALCLKITSAITFVLLVCSPIYSKLFLNSFSGIVAKGSDMAFSVFPIYLKPFLFLFVLTLGETVAPWNYLIVIPTIVVFGFLFLRTISYIKDENIVFMLIMCLTPIVIASFIAPTMPKYLIGSLPFYLMLISFSMSKIKNRSLFVLVLSLVMLVFAASDFNYFNLKEYHNSNQIEPWRQISMLVKGHYKKGDIIVASSGFISGKILNYYLNSMDGNKYEIVLLNKDFNVRALTNKRIWYVNHIVDERAFPDAFIRMIDADINDRYLLLSEESFVPYEDTIVSKLPINRHKKGAVRIKVRLYERKP